MTRNKSSNFYTSKEKKKGKITKNSKHFQNDKVKEGGGGEMKGGKYKTHLTKKVYQNYFQ